MVDIRFASWWYSFAKDGGAGSRTCPTHILPVGGTPDRQWQRLEVRRRYLAAGKKEISRASANLIGIKRIPVPGNGISPVYQSSLTMRLKGFIINCVV
jgi:hypothetical protein